MKKLLVLIFMAIFILHVAQGQEFEWYDYTLPADVRIEALINAMTLEEKVSQLMDQSKAIPRLNIPEYNWWNECLHGVARNGKSTVFPQAIGMAATFDPALIQKVSNAISDEARAKFNIAVKNGNRSRYAGLTFWSPNINIFRDPRWGRGQETYGEDPYLTSRMGIAFVKGLQGDNDKYLKAAACVKHFAVHSGPERLRHEFNAVISKRDLFETYLPAFEAVVKKANVEIVMGAYNSVLGEPACGSPFLLQKILRDKWGFKGHIVSDCGAISDIYLHHKIVKNAAEAAALAINSGVDLNCGDTYSHLTDAVKQGLVKEDTINARLRELLRTRFKLGLLDPVKINPYNSISKNVICSDEHRSIALETARKSLVLLSNKNHVLPLNPNMKKLYVTGPQANNSEVLIGNYYGMSPHLVNILEGITSSVGAGTTINYKQGCLPYRNNVNPIDWTTGEAKSSDATIVVLGISGAMEGEEGEAIASDSKGDMIKPYIPENQINFLRKLRKDNKKPLIVVITGGCPMIITEVEKLADAIIWAWYPGQEGGTAVADIVFGKISPSGKLPVTLLKSIDQLPPYEDYSMKGRTYKFLKSDPLFPFGYGLSYTKFEYKNITSSYEKLKRGNPVTVECDVKNIGDRGGEEVAQAYLVQPGAGDSAPYKKLVGFKRVNINKNETAHVLFEISPDEMAQYSEDGTKIIKKGEYTVIIGGSSPIKYMSRLDIAAPVKTSFQLK